MVVHRGIVEHPVYLDAGNVERLIAGLLKVKDTFGV